MKIFSYSTCLLYILGDDPLWHDGTYVQATVGTWVTTDAYQVRNYVCQMWPTGAPEPPPETPATGGCPDGWFKYKNR